MNENIGAWSIGKKLVGGFVLVASLAAVVGLFGRQRMEHIRTDLEDVVRLCRAAEEMAGVEVAMLQQLKTEKDFLLSGNSKDLDAHKRYQREIEGLIEHGISAAEGAHDKYVAEAFRRIKAENDEYERTFEEIVADVKAGKMVAAIALSHGKSGEEAEQMLGELRDLIQREDQAIEADSHDASSTARSASSLMLLIAAGAALFGTMLGVLLSRSITRPLLAAADASKALAQGDLRADLEVKGSDETAVMMNGMRRVIQSMRDMAAVASKIAEGDLTVTFTPRSEHDTLGRAISTMAEKLSDTIREVRGSASALASAAQQLSDSSQSVSQGTSEQAAAVEETTSSLEQMTASISQNSENGKQMEQMALKGASDAVESNAAVRETSQAMIKIAGKIEIIEEIAYQTNLLALNAAIEAARAGEHGRGFAVVATEVRKLAERSQVAAKEIVELAAGSVKVAERSGLLLGELAPSISKTANLVQEVVASSKEQAASVGQINRAMGQVDQVTQRNAAAAEELSSTAEETNAQAEALLQLVSFFRVTGMDDVTHRKSARTPAQPAPHTRVAPVPVRATNGSGDGEFKSF